MLCLVIFIAFRILKLRYYSFSTVFFSFIYVLKYFKDQCVHFPLGRKLFAGNGVINKSLLLQEYSIYIMTIGKYPNKSLQQNEKRIGEF